MKTVPLFRIGTLCSMRQKLIPSTETRCTKGVCRGTEVNLLALVFRAAEPRECTCQGSFLAAKLIGSFYPQKNVSLQFCLVTCEVQTLDQAQDFEI